MRRYCTGILLLLLLLLLVLVRDVLADESDALEPF